MNRSEYNLFQERFSEFCENNGNRSGFSLAIDSDPHFSWKPCECCGSSLGGNRYDVDYFSELTDSVESATICGNCLYYSCYGRLDDMTMQEIDNS